MKSALAKTALVAVLIAAQASSAAAYSVFVNTPGWDTPYGSGIKVETGGSYYWEWGETTPSALRIRSYDTDDITVADESLASTFSKVSPYEWAGSSKAPAGSPGQVLQFKIRYRLMGLTSKELGTIDQAILHLKVNGGGGS